MVVPGERGMWVCVLSPFRFHGFALSCAVSAHLRFALPAVRYSMEHTFDYTVTLFSPSATSISWLCLSDRKGTLQHLSLLRTERATFTALRSRIYNA